MAARRVERKARCGRSMGVALPPAAVGAHGVPMLPDSFRTARLVLQPIAPEDAGPIFGGFAQDAEVTRFLTWRTVRSRAETEAYIARCLATPRMRPAPTCSSARRTARFGAPSTCAATSRTASAMCWRGAVGAGSTHKALFMNRWAQALAG
jgi:Acetyltransferase (GNAT) domain